MRWLYVIISLCGIVLAVLAHSPLWFGAGIGIAMLFALVGAVAFAHERIAGSARPEELDEFELQQLRDAVRRRNAAAGSGTSSHDRSMHGPT